MAKKNKSIAEKYWPEFERLCKDLIKDQFDMEPVVLQNTPYSRDGGYDGEALFQISNAQKLDISLRILYEAKLRAGVTDVGLRTFAATLVIAYSNAAYALVVVTNQSYSPQAVQEVARFAQATRMKIRLVDGAAVSLWISGCYNSLLTRGYPTELIDWLRKKQPDEDKPRIYEIPLSPPSDDIPGSVAHLSIGGDNGKLLPCELLITTAEMKLSPIIGKKRQEVVDKLHSNMKEHKGVVVLDGASGSGKSFLLSHAILAMDIGKNIARVDLSSVRTASHLFLKIFECISGLNLQNLLFDSDLKNESIPRLLRRALGAPQADDLVAAVYSVLNSSDDNFHVKREINKALLSAYLGRVAQQQMLMKPFLVIFENLNKAVSEALDFLLVSINDISQYGVVLIELRTDGDALKTSPSDWGVFQDLFRRTATLGLLSTPNLTERDAIDLVEFWLPSLGVERANIIISRVGISPFFIELACLWLKQKGIVGYATQSAVAILELEVFFEGITPTKATVVIRGLINFWISHTECIYKEAILSAALLEGELPMAWLKRLAPTQDEFALCDKLVRTGIFERHKFNKSYIRIRHDLLRESCAELLDENEFFVEKLAAQLKGKVVELFGSGGKAKRLLVHISLRANDGIVAFLEAKQCASDFQSEGLLSDASEMWGMAYKAAELVPFSGMERDSKITEALFNQLKIEHIRNRLQLNINAGRLAALETHINTSPPVFESSELKIKLKLMQWRRLFLLERFEDARILIEKLGRDSTDCNDEMQASILCATALTSKGLGSPNAAQQKFDEAFTRFPSNTSVKRERLSNMAAAYLGSSPEKSLSIYLQIKDMLQNDASASLRNTLHVDVDIAMAYFLMGNYFEALHNAESASVTALANAYETQEARARNIAACCHWAVGRISSATDQIELAVFAAERSCYFRFLWRMRVNAAAIAVTRTDFKVATLHAIEAFRLITEPRERQYNILEIRRQRWYVGLLSTLRSLDQCESMDKSNQLVSLIPVPHLKDDLNAIRRGEWPVDVFKGTTHIHSNCIMVTG